MKKFNIGILGLVVFTLTVSSVQAIHGDHLELGQGIFKDRSQVNIITTENTKYQIYLQLSIRNSDGQLINVTESTANGSVIPYKMSDYVFDTLMSEKEIITINNIKYEKGQWKFNPTLEQRFVGFYAIYSELSIELVSEYGDDTAKMYESEKDFSHWKIHYCGTFEGHGITCIPVFQVLVPTMTLEPSDKVEQQWTILRELDG